MSEEQRREISAGEARAADPLTAHARQCDECRASSPPIERIVSALAADVVDIDPHALSQLAMARLSSELARRAAATFRRRVAEVVLVSLLPLPLVLVYNAYVLGAAYNLALTLLPAGLAAYMVLTYGALLLLLFAMTYAAIPLLLDRNWKARPAAPV